MKFLRSADSIKVLSSRSLFKYPTNIKSDLSPDELAAKSALLKEQRVLINQNIEHKRIKIKNNSLYLDNKLYCKFNGTEFVRSTSCSSKPTTSTQLSVMDTTTVNAGLQSS